MILYWHLIGEKRKQDLDSITFEWNELMKDIETPYYGWKDKYVGKIKHKLRMQQLIITDEHAVWAFRVINGKLQFQFQFWVYAE